MMKKSTITANAVLAIHLVWTAILFGGAVFVLFAPWYAAVQIAAISLTLLIALPFGGVCPLTTLEERLRRKTDPAYTNDGSYLTTYLNKAMETNFKKKTVIIAIALFYTASCVVSILTLVLRR